MTKPQLLNAQGKVLSSEKLIIDEYEIDVSVLKNNPFITQLLLIAIDPSPKQKLILDAVGVKLTDINGKYIYPKETNNEETSTTSNTSTKL